MRNTSTLPIAASDPSQSRVSFEPASGVMGRVPSPVGDGVMLFDFSRGKVSRRWPSLPIAAQEALASSKDLAAIWVFDLCVTTLGSGAPPLAERWPDMPVDTFGEIWVSVTSSGVYRVVVLEYAATNLHVLTFRFDPGAATPFGSLGAILSDFGDQGCAPSYAFATYARRLTAHVLERWFPAHLSNSALV